MKIVIAHFRSGERDGVSLEMEKRRKIFEELGHQVFYLTGYHPKTSTFKQKVNDHSVIVIDEMDIKKRLAGVLRESFFIKKIFDDNLAWLIYHNEEMIIYQEYKKNLLKLSPDIIFVHNIFSTAYHLPATTALYKFLDHYPIPTVAIYHDFYWERSIFRKAKHDFVNEILENLPEKKSYIYHHQTINSLAAKTLLKKRGIKSKVLGDCFDFETKVNQEESFKKNFFKNYNIDPNAYIFLQATRIVQRKAIENSILFSFYFQKKTKKKVYLILPNFIEVEAIDYFKKLKSLAEELGVAFLWVGDKYEAEDFFKFYGIADLVLYPSIAEGFGNQLFEAFWAKKPIVIFEYPVYKSDIKKEGYQVISLGDKIKKHNGFYLVDKTAFLRAVSEAEEILSDKKKQLRIVEKNFQIAKKYHSTKSLKKYLLKLLDFGRNI